jgi:MFS family permease
LYGIALGWSSPSAIKILDTERTFEMTSNQFAWAVSMNSFGAILGCFCTGIIRDRFGSRISIALFTVPSFCGWMALSFARAWWMVGDYYLLQNFNGKTSLFLQVILGRLLIGIAAAGYSYNVLIYIGECASKEIRGKLLTFYEITLKCGILFSYALGTFTSLSTTNFICTALVIGYCVAFTCLLPESPLFLMKQHKSEQAKKSLRYLRGRHYKMDEELLSLQNEIAELERTRRPFWQEIKTESTRNAFLILIFMFFFFQMCGINAVVFYTTTILIESGIKINPFLATCILGSIQVISVLCATAFVDRYGRRILLILSNLVMMIGLLAVAVYFLVKESIDVSGFEWLPLASLCVYLIGFSFGVGSVTFVLLGEMFSLNAKRVRFSFSWHLFSILITRILLQACRTDGADHKLPDVLCYCSFLSIARRSNRHPLHFLHFRRMLPPLNTFHCF